MRDQPTPVVDQKPDQGQGHLHIENKSPGLHPLAGRDARRQRRRQGQAEELHIADFKRKAGWAGGHRQPEGERSEALNQQSRLPAAPDLLAAAEAGAVEVPLPDKAIARSPFTLENSSIKSARTSFAHTVTQINNSDRRMFIWNPL